MSNLSRLAIPLILALCTGCGDGLVDLRAHVTLDGKPAENVALSLISTGETRNRTAYGTSDAEGNVRFTTFDDFDGVMPGEYKVVATLTPNSEDEVVNIINFDPKDEESVKRFMEWQSNRNATYVPSILPPIYSNPDRTPFRITVPVEEQPVVIALESKPPGNSSRQ